MRVEQLHVTLEAVVSDRTCIKIIDGLWKANERLYYELHFFIRGEATGRDRRTVSKLGRLNCLLLSVAKEIP